MSDTLERYLAPIIILVIILIAWEGLVAAFQIQQFLLPRPTVILSNLVQVIHLTPTETTLTDEELQDRLKDDQLMVTIPAEASPELTAALSSAAIIRLPWFNSSLLILQGENLNPILQAAWYTLKEALGGFIIGCSAGIIVALISSRWVGTREALMPFAIAANSMPIIAFAPIANNWFGIDNPFSKMFIVAIMVFFPVMINLVRGLTQVDSNSLELMRSYAASDTEIIRKLRIPNALPFLFNGLKIAAALSMIGAVVGEYFGGPRIALGVFITQEAALFRFSSAWAAIIIACIMGITLYLIIILLERLAMPWHVSFR
ncbi:MAG: ABC transporter permease subunit [Anaerolineae bacterium]|nr:ABC transporter permease subunit [Anaerolineae bacterium]MCB0178950.1 ABC transporter permease subunit [Anaerolineae bacterium]MCB0223929.1 ABC transporter permease subunit [Anaerolineae bacterium]